MEKYSRWSDLTTGINPFVPHKPRFHANPVVKVLQVATGSILCVARLVLLTVVLAVFALLTVIVNILGLVPFVDRPLRRLIEGLCCSLLLWLMGVFTHEGQADTRRLSLSVGASKRSVATRIGRGDVIVCNHTSFLEILYLARRFSPVFVFVNEQDAAKGVVRPCGTLGALAQALAQPRDAGADSSSRQGKRKLAEVVAMAYGPVVVFPEGARSNGRSVLRFTTILEHLPLEMKRAPLRLHLMAFRYEFKNFSPSHCAGSGWRHVMSIWFRPYHSMRITWLPAEYLALQERAGGKSGSSSLATTTLAAAEVERLRQLLAMMLRTKPVDLTASDFASFNAYWTHVTNGGRQPASNFTARKAPHEHAQWSTTRK